MRKLREWLCDLPGIVFVTLAWLALVSAVAAMTCLLFAASVRFIMWGLRPFFGALALALGGYAGAGEAWIGAGNDSPDRDDHRTAWVGAGFTTGRLVAAADWSILTSAADDARADEATATLGWRLGPVVLGAGLRLTGNLGGYAVQREIHEACNADDWPRDAYAADRAAGVAIASVARRWGPLEASAGGLLSTEGEASADIAARLRWRWLWAGGRYRLHNGEAMSVAARATAEHERGAWAEAGADIGPVGLACSVRDRDDWSYGLTLRFAWGAP